jgi:hypothetical protein
MAVPSAGWGRWLSSRSVRKFGQSGIPGARELFGSHRLPSACRLLHRSGGAPAPIQVTFDAQSPAKGGWWQLSLNRTTLVVTIEYTDVDLPDVGDKRSWIMTPDKCVANMY